ncbi:sol narae metalloprotease isoform 2-T4 [Glossina fuscipes fuscipes]
MLHTNGIILALVSIAVTTCKALPDLQKQMSPHQLRAIFHVDTYDSIPNYEIVQLLHHNSDAEAFNHLPHYRRRRRSIEDTLPTETEIHQPIKKDLSKSAYYSKLKREQYKRNEHVNSVYAGLADDLRKEFKKEHKITFEAFGENINLTLRPTQGLFKDAGGAHKLPMWYVHPEANATNGLNIQKIEDEDSYSSEHIGEVYQDEDNMAAVLMRRHEVTGDLVMEGSIGHDLVIKPLPHNLSPNKDKSHHVIYKRDTLPLDHLSDFAFMEPDDLKFNAKLQRRRRSFNRQHRTTLDDIEMEEEFLEAEDHIENDELAAHQRDKRQAPYIIYPEILVIVDYDGYRLHGGDNLQVKRYFISFWNGVDLRYRLLKGPRIRISIAGIIISRGRDATPYLERNRVGRDAIDSAAALTDMGKYLFRERRLPVYDIAVAITKYDMCRRRKGGRCTKGTAGFAYVGGACVVNKRLEKVNSVAIIEDTGGFSGIIVAAHEVGHLLGAVHDGSPPPSYLGGPGAQRCRWEDGYIMSDLRHTERGFRWSPCTVQSFHHFLNGDTATCLHNAPHEDSALGRSLPGTLLSLDAQCRRDRGTYACFKDERVCAQLFCFDAQTGYCVAYRPAAEGSSCGNGLHCLDGRCSTLPSNAVNYGSTKVGYNASSSNQERHLHNGEDEDSFDDLDDETRGGFAFVEENEENNEAIEKQKRKFSLPVPGPPPQTSHAISTTTTITSITNTITSMQQQASPTPLPTTTAPIAVVGTSRYGFKSTTTRNYNPTHVFFENYFKKLHVLNAPTASTSTTESIAATTLTTALKKVKTKLAPSYPVSNKNSFEAQFLKRTLNHTTGSGSISTNNHSYSNNQNEYTNNSSSNNHNNQNNNNSNNNQVKELETITTTPQTPPIYVTNFISDQSKRLSSIVQQQQKQQHQLQQKQQTRTQQKTSTATTTRKPKIKTQKLIRRLRTQIK